MCVCVSPLHPWPLSPLPQNNLCECVSSCHCPSCYEGTWLLFFHSQSWWHCCLPASPCCQSWGGPISQCQSLRGICWSWDWYGLSTHVCFRLKFLAFFLHSTALVPKCSWLPVSPPVPPLKKTLYELSPELFTCHQDSDLCPGLWPGRRNEGWSSQWKISYIPNLHAIYYPVILLKSSLYAWPSPQDRHFPRRFLHLPLKYAASRSFHSSPATPGVWNSLWMPLLNFRALLVWHRQCFLLIMKNRQVKALSSTYQLRYSWVTSKEVAAELRSCPRHQEEFQI